MRYFFIWVTFILKFSSSRISLPPCRTVNSKPLSPSGIIPRLIVGALPVITGVFVCENEDLELKIVELSGDDIVTQFLKDEGVEYIFGYPGGAVLHIYDALFRQDAVKHIPLDRIMLETDAPYLLPRDLTDKPVHSRRNEPCFLPHICKVTARYMGVDEEELAIASVENTKRFFNF